jgi:cell division protein FtsB
MTEEKMRKIITASVAAGTLLLVFLLGFLIYQWIYSSVLDKRIEALKAENAQLQQINEENEKDLAYYESIFGKEWLAFQYGFVDPNSMGD